MRPFPFKKKLNNKGITLTELLVTIAISGIVFTVIVALISSGMRFFNKQSNTINLQNELQLVSNQITETFQEAKALNITTTPAIDADTPATSKIITGVIPVGASDISSGRYVYWDGKNLYIMDSLKVDADKMDGYCLSHYVSKFSIDIDEDCKVYTNNGVTGPVLSYFKDPLVVTFTITVADNDEERTTSLTCKLRNSINKIEITDNGSHKEYDCK